MIFLLNLLWKVYLILSFATVLQICYSLYLKKVLIKISTKIIILLYLFCHDFKQWNLKYKVLFKRSIQYKYKPSVLCTITISATNKILIQYCQHQLTVIRLRWTQCYGNPYLLPPKNRNKISHKTDEWK